MLTLDDIKVDLVTHTENPLPALFMLWHQSKQTDHWSAAFRSASELVVESAWFEKERHDELTQTFWDLWNADVPLLENVSFTFVVRNCPVALREQMVRHRIGHHFGSNYGVDVVPDLAESTWWAQSMRVLDMSNFADEGRYLCPESVFNGPAIGDDPLSGEVHQLRQDWKRCMEAVQATYRRAVRRGVPHEEARGLVPLFATHDISWTCNLKALKHVLTKRSCWILQLSLWRPVIEGVIDRLREVHPLLGQAVLPPCFSRGSFKTCSFDADNVRRLRGDEALPPCPLWLQEMNRREERGMSRPSGLSKDLQRWLKICDQGRNAASRSSNEWARVEQFYSMVDRYAVLWNMPREQVLTQLELTA